MTPGARRWKFAAALFAGALLAQACSPDDRATNAENIAELYELSDVPVRVELMIEHFAGPLERERHRWTPEQFAVAKDLIGDRFAPDVVKAKVLEKLSSAANSPHLVPVLEWLRSDATRRVNRAAGGMYTAEGRVGLRAFIESRETVPPSDERLALIERYDQATRVSRDNMKVMLLATYGVGLMVDANRPRGERHGADQLKQAVALDDPALAPVFKEISAIMSQFAFRNFSDEEVATFVAHCESEAGQWYYSTLPPAFLGSVEEIADDLGDAFAYALSARGDD